jgi:hypothetical protein
MSKQLLVQFDDQVAAAIMACLAESDGMLQVRVDGLEAGNAPPILVQHTKQEKSLRLAGYDAIVRAIKGLERPGG